MAVHGSLGYEQARADLLVAQPVGDEPCDIRLSFSENAGARMFRGCGDSVRFTESEPHCVVPAQTSANLELRRVFRRAKSSAR